MLCKHLLLLLIITPLMACTQQMEDPLNNSAKAPDQKSPYELITEKEHELSVKKLTAALQKAQSNPVNDTIIYGLVIGGDENEFEAFKQRQVERCILKKSGKYTYDGEYVFKFNDGSTENVDITSSSSGMFENWPRITFKTIDRCDDLEQVTALRNKFIDWAVEQYGSDYFITLNHSDPNGKNSDLVTNNYTWICGSYQLDIVIGNCQVVLTYSKF